MQQKTLFQKFFLHKKLYLFILLSVVCVFIIILLQKTRVSRIEVIGTDLVKGLRHYSNYPLLLLSEEKIQNDIATVNPHLTQIRVEKKYPHKLIIRARELQQVATLKLADGYAQLAESGVVLVKSRALPENQLPLITFYQPLYYNQLIVGDTLSFEEIQAGLSVLEAIEGMGSKISTIDIADADMIVLQTETYSVFASAEVDSQLQKTRFEYTYAEFKRRGKDVLSIDVRFERPIIKLKK